MGGNSFVYHNSSVFFYIFSNICITLYVMGNLSCSREGTPDMKMWSLCSNIIKRSNLESQPLSQICSNRKHVKKLSRLPITIRSFTITGDEKILFPSLCCVNIIPLLAHMIFRSPSVDIDAI